MPTVSFLRPVDQPTGKQRLLHELQNCLVSPHYTHFRFAVAFAKKGPLLRLLPDIQIWKNAKKKIECIIGIDHLGTSLQALNFALATFDRVFVTHLDDPRSPRVTFHPKLYLFSGDHHATCFYGSHNLTVGGTETNYEGGVKIEFDLPADESSFKEALDCWVSLLPEYGVSTRLLDDQLLKVLINAGLLFDENKPTLPRVINQGGLAASATFSSSLFPSMRVKPPSALPKLPASVKRKNKSYVSGTSENSASVLLSGRSFVIQIIPHDNGEIHLSKKAIDQNQSFFGFPFTGTTTPKKPSNKPYQQWLPDPLVDISVYDSNGQLMLQRKDFQMNTVYYDDASELRVTFSASLARAIPAYSIMVMNKNSASTSIYDIKIFVPGSEQFHDYLAVCNQTLPSGGKAQPRKMGWL